MRPPPVLLRRRRLAPRRRPSGPRRDLRRPRRAPWGDRSGRGGAPAPTTSPGWAPRAGAGSLRGSPPDPPRPRTRGTRPLRRAGPERPPAVPAPAREAPAGRVPRSPLRCEDPRMPQHPWRSILSPGRRNPATRSPARRRPENRRVTTRAPGGRGAPAPSRSGRWEAHAPERPRSPASIPGDGATRLGWVLEGSGEGLRREGVRRHGSSLPEGTGRESLRSYRRLGGAPGVEAKRLRRDRGGDASSDHMSASCGGAAGSRA